MISIEHLTYKYPEAEKPAVSDFNLYVDRGEFVVLTGPSGCGKTTLIRLLLRELKADNGMLTVLNDNLIDMKDKDVAMYRRNLGVVFQENRLLEDRSVYENIMFVAKVTGMTKKEASDRVIAVMSMMGITDLHNRLPNQLSGGQIQKVCMARALMLNPSILLCDEPTGNLDPTSSVEIMKLLNLIHSNGVTIVMASHDINLIKQFDVKLVNIEGAGKDGN